MKRIDRIDTKGDIREHVVDDRRERTTLCGLTFAASQPPCGNRTCKRCEQLAAKRNQKSP